MRSLASKQPLTTPLYRVKSEQRFMSARVAKSGNTAACSFFPSVNSLKSLLVGSLWSGALLWCPRQTMSNHNSANAYGKANRENCPLRGRLLQETNFHPSLNIFPAYFERELIPIRPFETLKESLSSPRGALPIYLVL